MKSVNEYVKEIAEDESRYIRATYPEPLLNLIEWSDYTIEEVCEKLEITIEELNCKLLRKIRWTAKDKRILSTMLHIPVYYLIDYFVE